MSNTIELLNITKDYGKSIPVKVLKDISIKFEKGSLNAIIGQSGSGKSTLLNIMGLLDKPTSGSIYLDGKKINDFNNKHQSRLRNENIGFIFQFHYLLPEWNVWENILMPLRIRKDNITDKMKDRAKMIMEAVGITDIAKEKIQEISGGQQQRTAIARALITNPKIILADEPTGNLDSINSDAVYNLIKSLNEEFNTTFIIITHDERLAKKTNRIIELEDGIIKSDTLL
ncbi:MAG: ABC transporter ATP-binding protein [Candidatus Heimdallarchaeota archaeon]|nr:ABC transporter ATP-binding protein [Candidatus Heimdallarchaeota archaeon]